MATERRARSDGRAGQVMNGSREASEIWGQLGIRVLALGQLAVLAVA